jgi:hypothetical protein
VFCHPCLLQYLHSGGSEYHTCPICHEFVYAKDAKFAAFIPIKKAYPDKSLELKLMQRPLVCFYLIPLNLSLIVLNKTELDSISSSE